MWQDIKMNGVEKIEKCIGEFVIWMHSIKQYPEGLSENDIEYTDFSDF